METIKRQTRAAYGCLVGGKSPWARSKPTAYRLYVHSICDTKAPLQLQHVVLCECYTPLHLP